MQDYRVLVLGGVLVPTPSATITLSSIHVLEHIGKNSWILSGEDLEL